MKFRNLIKQIVVDIASPNIKRYLTEYQKTDCYSKQQIDEYQMEKLCKLLDFSYRYVPYYTDLFDSLHLKPTDIVSVNDLQKLPILTKEIIWKEGSRLWATKEMKGVKDASTSGSSGHPVVLKKTKEAREIEQALMYRYRNNAGVNPNECSLMIWGGHSFSRLGTLKNKCKQWILNEYFYDTYQIKDSDISEIIDILSSGRIKYLRGYTSAIYYIAQQILDRGLHFDIPFISVTAEKLLDSQRVIIEKALGSNLFDQYGCGECGAIAYECSEHKGLHHNFEHSILEVLDDNDSPSTTGRVVLTNLDNYAMPLIRYENGDVVTLANEDCTCGRQSTFIKKIEGRTYDMFYGENGQKVHAGFLDDVLLEVDLLNKYQIKQLQIVQKEPLLFVCRYIADNMIFESDRVKLESIYQRYLGEHIQMNLQKVEMMHIPESGKRHFIIPYNKYLENPKLYD